MSKTHHSPPDELYREYQSSRDNIPQASLTALRSAAENKRAEDNINAILEQAKPIHARGEQTSVTESKSEHKSVFTGIMDWLFGNAWGLGSAAIAGALVALVGLPFFSQNIPPYSQFSECGDCASYIANASALTRSATLTRQRTNPEQRLAAKKGRLSAKLEIANAAKLTAVKEQAFKEFEKLAERDANLSTQGQSSDVKSVINALATSSSNNSDVYLASKALFIANVTARNAKNLEQTEIQDSLIAANTAYASVLEPNELQKDIRGKLLELSEMRSFTNTQLEKIIEITRRAMESLG